MKRSVYGRSLFLTLGLMALTTPSYAGTELLVSDSKKNRGIVEKALGNLGKVTGVHKTGFFKVQLNNGVTLEAARKALKAKGVAHAHEADADYVDPNSLPSVRKYLGYRKSLMAVNKLDEESAGVDFYEGLENYLRVRVNEEGVLDQEAYQRAVAQRDAMPVARRDWFSDTNNPGGLFAYVGPKNLDIPYRTYYGVKPLSGRKNDIAYAPSNTSVLYTASAGGGIWKTTDAGLNWLPKSENWKFLHTSSVAVHPSNSNIVLAGTGDYVGFFTAQTFGIMRSTDGGTTWLNHGAADFGDKVVSRIIYTPENANNVVASTGRGGASAGDIWRSTDGGVTWNRTNAPDGNWDDMDIAKTSFIGSNRYIWAVGGNKIARSTDGGATWTSVTPPSGWNNSIADVAASQNDPDGAYILGSGGTCWKTADGGTTWTNITSGIPSGYNWSQATYDIHITCGDGGSSDVIYVGLITVAASDDGGTTWADISRSYQSDSKWHNDQHCMAVHPTTANVGVIGGDGGLAAVVYSPSTNAANITPLNATIYDTQFYFMSLHPTNGAYVMGGTQDNASPASRGNLDSWANLYAGDGGGSGFDGGNPGKHYTTAQNGAVYRYDTALDTTATDISHNTGVFVTPLAMAGSNKSTVYSSGSSKLKRNANGTSGWSNSTTTMNSSAQNISVSNFSNLRIFTAHANGDVWMSTDGGVTLAKRDGTTLPNYSIGDIEESTVTPYHMLAAVQTTNSNAGVWRTTNLNTATPTWTNVSGSGATRLPEIPCNALARDPHDTNTYYAGTDVGLFVTKNAGSTWYNMNGLGLPNVHVNDLWVNSAKNYLYVATFGRGIWRIPLKSVKLTSLSISPTAVYGGNRAYALAYLDATASPDTRISMYDNNSSVTTPSSVIVPVGSTVGVGTLITQAVTSTNVATISAVYGGVTKTATLTIYRVPAISSLTLSPSTVYGGFPSTGTVQLGSAAPISTSVKLSETSANMSLPSLTVTIPAGSSSGTFTVNTTAVTADTTGTVNAYVAPNTAATASATLGINRLPILTTFTVTPNPVIGGTTATGTVRIDRPAQSGGVTVSVSDNRSALTDVPASVVIPAGSTSAVFPIATQQVGKVSKATLFTTYRGVTKSVTLVVNPN